MGPSTNLYCSSAVHLINERTVEDKKDKTIQWYSDVLDKKSKWFYFYAMFRIRKAIDVCGGKRKSVNSCEIASKTDANISKLDRDGSLTT